MNNTREDNQTNQIRKTLPPPTLPPARPHALTPFHPPNLPSFRPPFANPPSRLPLHPPPPEPQRLRISRGPEVATRLSSTSHYLLEAPLGILASFVSGKCPRRLIVGSRWLVSRGRGGGRLSVPVSVSVSFLVSRSRKLLLTFFLSLLICLSFSVSLSFCKASTYVT